MQESDGCGFSVTMRATVETRRPAVEMMQKAAEMNSRRVAPVAPLTSVEVEVVREPPKSATDERRGGPGRDGGHPRRLACLHAAFGDEFSSTSLRADMGAAALGRWRGRFGAPCRQSRARVGHKGALAVF